MANGVLTGFVFAKYNVQMFVLAAMHFKTGETKMTTVGKGGWEGDVFYSDCISYLVL